MCLTRPQDGVNILAPGAFTVSMADRAHVTECDYLGLAWPTTLPDKLARPVSHRRGRLVDAPLQYPISWVQAFVMILSPSPSVP